MNRQQVTKADWTLTNLVLLVVVAISAEPFVRGLVGLVGGQPLRLTTGAVVASPAVQDPNLSPGIFGVYTPQAVFTIPDASAGQWLAHLLVPLITLVVGVVCVWQVHRLVGLVRRDEPFHPRAHLAVRLLGLVLFGYGLFTPLVAMLMTALITIPMRAGELNMALNWPTANWWPVAVGLVVGVVGESVFVRGRQLDDDTEGLV